MTHDQAIETHFLLEPLANVLCRRAVQLGADANAVSRAAFHRQSVAVCRETGFPQAVAQAVGVRLFLEAADLHHPAVIALLLVVGCCTGRLVHLAQGNIEAGKLLADAVAEPRDLGALRSLAAVIPSGWARVRLARRMSATFGTKHQNFRPLDTTQRAALHEIIARKQGVLGTLDPDAREGTFSLTLAHWLRRPRAALAYARLVRAENRLMGTRGAVGAEQAYWRPLHLALAYLFVLGIFIHVVTVTFFAGYVADYGDIYWWHLAEW